MKAKKTSILMMVIGSPLGLALITIVVPNLLFILVGGLLSGIPGVGRLLQSLAALLAVAAALMVPAVVSFYTMLGITDPIIAA
jgi:hypothetical protein